LSNYTFEPTLKQDCLKCIKRMLILAFSFLVLLPISIYSQSQVKCGADRIELYLPLVKNKNVAVVANQASTIGSVNLVDSLIRSEVNVVRIFCPEHGFRDYADAGSSLKDYIDSATQVPVVSLYNNKKKPDPDDLEDVDVVLFDLQDVGVRFFTYLSTLSLVMESCAENKVPLIVLDRPNPNGFYIDGPVIDSTFFSFVGLHPVPVVYGMTIGEYAQMVNEEGWLKKGMICELQVIQLKNYTHKTRYQLPVAPSPNLRNMNAVYLYPSLCLFEGTKMSVGRGTSSPFEVMGSPEMTGFSFSFVPEVKNSKSVTPLFSGQTCYGLDLHNALIENPDLIGKINLSWLIMAYGNMGNDPKFFNGYFDKLAGNSLLRRQIISGVSEDKIRNSWKQKISLFKQIRTKYLLYPD
jgi:uncharacterized protein YbbC (DUF1343 family)